MRFARRSSKGHHSRRPSTMDWYRMSLTFVLQDRLNDGAMAFQLLNGPFRRANHTRRCRPDMALFKLMTVGRLPGFVFHAIGLRDLDLNVPTPDDPSMFEGSVHRE